jgi:hypothetical protein
MSIPEHYQGADVLELELELYLLLLTDPESLLVGPFPSNTARRRWKKEFLSLLEDDALYLSDSRDAIEYIDAIAISPREELADVEDWFRGEDIDFERTDLEAGCKVLPIRRLNKGPAVIVGPLDENEAVWVEKMQFDITGLRWPFCVNFYPITSPAEFIKVHEATIYCYRNMPHPRNCPKCYPDAPLSAQGSVPVALKVAGTLEGGLWECVGPFDDDESAQKLCDEINDDPVNAGPAFLTHAFVQHLFQPPEKGEDFVGRAWQEKSPRNRHLDKIPEWLIREQKRIQDEVIAQMRGKGVDWPPKSPRHHWPHVIVMYDGPSPEEGSYMIVGPFPSVEAAHDWLDDYGRGRDRLQSKPLELWSPRAWRRMFTRLKPVTES